MCGIIGIVGSAVVTDRLVAGLKRLEYRGYDSSGVAVIENDALIRSRAEGKLSNLQGKLDAQAVDGHIGIAHTRWATHGVPNETNAHPHFAGRVGIVHNGIIENFLDLRQSLNGRRTFSTETDTEVVAHLIDQALNEGHEPKAAFQATLKKIVGAYALCVLIEGHDDHLYAARSGAPLAIGIGDGEMYVGGVSRLIIIACGTAYYAGLVAKYWFEQQAGLAVDIDVASEFRYRAPVVDKDALFIAVSQSGETADTLAALRYCKEKGLKTAALVNVMTSTMAREAVEGALKLKEISYIHAEGYAAGELKHGPIALIEDGTPVIVIAPHDPLFEKTISNLQEVASRGAQIILITDTKGAELAGSMADELITLPDADPFVAPLITSIAVQLLAYHTAVHRGTDVDQPRNLAKSVTVE